MKTYFSLLVIAASLAAGGANAQLQLPRIFSDSMVLQRNQPIKVWGWAKQGDRITVKFHNQQQQALANASGSWQAVLKPETAGGPYNLQVNNIILKGILVGDIWVCSGQSNMEMPVKGWSSVYNADEEIAQANYPNIRLITVEKNVQGLPVDDLKGGKWETCNPQSVQPFSAVGYFFGRELYRQTKVPIGLINSSWGGTDIESWISRAGFKSDPYFNERIGQAPEKSSADLTAEREKKTRAWIASLKIDAAEVAKLSQWKNTDYDDAAWPQIQVPDLWEHQQPGAQFDGIIWYRKEITLDETDAGKPAQLQLAMIDDNDETYVNGVKVGGINGYNVKRVYTVDASLLKKGKNVIAVRVEDTGGGGGIYGEPADCVFTIGDKKISLADTWKYQMQEARTNGNGVGPNDYPSVLYNGMIHPFEQLAIKGVIWYQGENNAGRAIEYRKAMPLLIKDWRMRFKENNMPFYIVQLASFGASNGNSEKGSTWAELREAQAMATTSPNTGMAVTIDIGDAADIHPRNKQDVGKRLAALALQKNYGFTKIVTSPQYKSMQVTGNEVVVQFISTGKGLMAKPGSTAIEGFEIAGADQRFYPAKAVIEGDKVKLSAPEVAQPVVARYAWMDDAGKANVFNKEGFPLAPFRTDNWKAITDEGHYKPAISF